MKKELHLKLILVKKVTVILKEEKVMILKVYLEMLCRILAKIY
jgi:hypothetical protein